jgi:hypothetical protein
MAEFRPDYNHNPEGEYDKKRLVRAIKDTIKGGFLPDKLPSIITAENLQRFLDEPGDLPETGRRALIKVAKHPEILERLPRQETDVYEPIPKPYEGFSDEKKELLKTPMTREEMKDCFSLFVRLLQNTSSMGATFVAGKHYLGTSAELQKTRDQIFPDREDYRQEIRNRTGVNIGHSTHTMDNNSPGGLMYIDSQLAKKQLKLFDEISPDAVQNLLNVGNLEAGFFFTEGQKFGTRRPQEKSETSSNYIQSAEWLGDILKNSGSLKPVGIKFTDVYFPPQDKNGTRKNCASIDANGKLVKAPAVTPYRCAHLEIQNKYPGDYPPEGTRRWRELNVTVIFSETNSIYDGINSPDSLKPPRGIHHPMFKLLRAMRTDPAFLVEALRQVYPNAFTSSQPNHKFYFDPNFAEQVPVYAFGNEFDKDLKTPQVGDPTPKIAKYHTPANFRYERGEE